jgi:prophage regulatory protein
MSNQTQLADTVFRLPQVMARVGLSRSSIYAMVAAGTFPSPVAIGARARGWLSSEIDGFIASCAKQRQQPQRTVVANAVQS